MPGLLRGCGPAGQGGCWGWVLWSPRPSGKDGGQIYVCCAEQGWLARATQLCVGTSGCISGLTVIPDTCGGWGEARPQAQLLLLPASDPPAWGARCEGGSLAGDGGGAQLRWLGKDGCPWSRGRGGSRGDPRPHAALGPPCLQSPLTRDRGQGSDGVSSDGRGTRRCLGAGLRRGRGSQQAASCITQGITGAVNGSWDPGH